MKKMLVSASLLVLLSISAFAAGEQGSWTGWVSDAKCGAKVGAACAKKCAEAGQPLVFVNDADKSVLTVSNPDVLKGHEGHHVKVNGSVENNTLTISSLSMEKDQTMK